MRRNSVSILCHLFYISIMSLLIGHIFPVHAAKIHVHPGGSIQGAINTAFKGDELIVHEGTYYEDIDFSERAVAVRRSDPDAPDVVAAIIIDGSINGDGSAGCRIYYQDEDKDRHGEDGESRCLCSPDASTRYTALYSGDPDDSDPNVLGTILTGHIDLPSGWSMISLPLEPDDSRSNTLFPDAGAVFEFTTKYELLDPNDELIVGKGYWIYLSAPNTYTLTGTPVEKYSIPNCLSGWRMIGGCSWDSMPSVDNGDIRAVFGFSNKYDLLGVNDPLEPGKGYWINLAERAMLTLSNSGLVLHGPLSWDPNEEVSFNITVSIAPNDVQAFLLDISFDPNILNVVARGDGFVPIKKGALTDKFIVLAQKIYPDRVRMGGIVLPPEDQNKIKKGVTGEFVSLSFVISKSYSAKDIRIINLLDDVTDWPTRTILDIENDNGS